MSESKMTKGPLQWIGNVVCDETGLPARIDHINAALARAVRHKVNLDDAAKILGKLYDTKGVPCSLWMEARRLLDRIAAEEGGA